MALLSLCTCLWAMLHSLSQLPVFLFRNRKATGVCPGISVVICGRNALRHWQTNLPAWVNQELNGLPVEFVLVDDASSDQSLAFLMEMAGRDARIKPIALPLKKNPGKRDALLAGMQAASHAQLWLTDADCAPTSPNTLRQIAQNLGAKPTLLLGVGSYGPWKPILPFWVALDAQIIARRYLSLAWLGIPSMAVGRHLACPKAQAIHALKKSYRKGLASGDDDLSLFELWKTCPSKAWTANPETQTISLPPKNWKDWAAQKKRHWSTAPHYPTSVLLVFGLRQTSRCMAWAALILSFCQLISPTAVFFTGLAWLSQAFAQLVWSLRFTKAVPWPWLVAADLMFIFVGPALWFLQLLGKKKSWE